MIINQPMTPNVLNFSPTTNLFLGKSTPIAINTNHLIQDGYLIMMMKTKIKMQMMMSKMKLLKKIIIMKKSIIITRIL